jgi:methyl coenzyme M reductase gamma subunit
MAFKAPDGLQCLLAGWKVVQPLDVWALRGIDFRISSRGQLIEETERDLVRLGYYRVEIPTFPPDAYPFIWVRGKWLNDIHGPKIDKDLRALMTDGDIITVLFAYRIQFKRDTERSMTKVKH